MGDGEAVSLGVGLALAGFFLALLTHTAILFRWGSRLQVLVEQHEEQINGDKHGLRVWKHDLVTPRLMLIDSLYEDQKEDRAKISQLEGAVSFLKEKARG